MINQCKQTWAYFLMQEAWKKMAAAVDSMAHHHCQGFMVRSHYCLQMVPSAWSNFNMQGRKKSWKWGVGGVEFQMHLLPAQVSHTHWPELGPMMSQDPGHASLPEWRRLGKLEQRDCLDWFRPSPMLGTRLLQRTRSSVGKEGRRSSADTETISVLSKSRIVSEWRAVNIATL